jgi:hypothetical protein
VADIRTKYVPPTVDRGAFNCPHCGALAKQFWFTVHAQNMQAHKTPRIVIEEVREMKFEQIKDHEVEHSARRLLEKLAKEKPFLYENRSSRSHDVGNIFISSCFSCNDVAFWVYDRLVWPQVGEAPVANPDLPDDIRCDYNEASSILSLSPRGAAALLRLAVQKLCKHLGGAGDNLNHDIAALVRKGLPARVQQALDVVRVIGNNAVHPGEIDLRDDRATAEGLFRLVNLIAEIMISQPKHVSDMFASLPEGARKAIETRDGG